MRVSVQIVVNVCCVAAYVHVNRKILFRVITVNREQKFGVINLFIVDLKNL